MAFSESIYYGYIVKGDLNGAISYIRQFPDPELLPITIIQTIARTLFAESNAEISRKGGV